MPGADQALSITIKAKDEASAVFNSVQSNVKKLSVGFEDAVSASTKMAIGLAGVGTAAVAFGYKAVTAAADAEKEMAKFGATLATMGPKGAAAKDAILAAAKAAVQLGFDDEDAANSIANLFQRTGDLNEALKLNGLAMDLARAKNIDLSEAQKLVSMVMSGNQRALKLYGIEISDTLTPMQALGELQTKVAGQSVAFSETFQGQMAQFHQQFENLLEAIGTHLLPLLTEMLAALNPIVEKIGEWSENTAVLVKWLDEHRTVLMIVVGAIVGALTPAFIALSVTIVTAVIPAFIAAGVALAPWIIGGAIIAGIIAGIMWMIHHWDLVMEKIHEVMNNFSLLYTILTPLLGPAGAIFAGVAKGIIFMIDHWSQLIATVQFVIDKFQALIDMFKKVIDLSKTPANFTTNWAGGPATGAGSAPSFINPNAAWATPHEFGGVVPGPVGTAVPIIAHGQERVIPVGQGSGGGSTIMVTINNPVVRSDNDLRTMQEQLENFFRQLTLNNKFG